MRGSLIRHVTHISKEEELPFLICIRVGKGDKEIVIPIDHLTRSVSEFSDYIYNIQEYRSIQLELLQEEEGSVRIVWDKLNDRSSYILPYTFLLSQNIQKIIVYEQGVTEEFYPWNCGVYCFEVQYKGESYWAGFQIVPKNLTNEQLYDVHDLIHQEVTGLTLESQKTNQTQTRYDKTRQLETTWFVLKKQLEDFERNVKHNSLMTSYKVKRKIEKEKSNDISIKRAYEKSLEELNVFKIKCVEIIKDNHVSTPSIQEILEEVESFIIKFEKYKSETTRLNSQHRSTSYIKQTNFLNRSLMFYTNTFKKDFTSNVPDGVKEFRPFKQTYLIYEYYCYFFLLNILRELRFEPIPSMNEQLNQILRNNVVCEPAVIILRKGKFIIHLVYNEIIDTYQSQDERVRSGLYSLEERRKPDIRIDLYMKIGNELEFLSSQIFEVKYSPIFNIYQQSTTTKAMEQLKKYWSLKYVEKKIGMPIQFKRNAIYEVICLYPGSNYHGVILETPFAVYIQAYPRRTKKNKTYYIGKSEIRNILKKWLMQYD